MNTADNPANDIQVDAMTHFLARVRFEAQIYNHQSYCGSWAFDTSGSGHIPFHLIDKGSAWAHSKGNEPQLLQAGDLVLFPRDLPHAISNDRIPPEKNLINDPHKWEAGEAFTSVLCGFYVFDSAAAQALLDDLPDIVMLLDARNNTTTTGVGYIIDATLVEVENNLSGRTAAICDLARLLLLHILRGHFADASSTGYLAALSDPQISQSLLLIHSRFGEDWTLESLAREAGMSRTSFANRFHSYVGMPPAKYLTAWRMQEATTLLKNTTLSIEQIAEQCGYKSAVSFRKAYKYNTGLTPTQVRLQQSRTLIGKATHRLLRLSSKWNR